MKSFIIESKRVTIESSRASRTEASRARSAQSLLLALLALHALHLEPSRRFPVLSPLAPRPGVLLQQLGLLRAPVLRIFRPLNLPRRHVHVHREVLLPSHQFVDEPLRAFSFRARVRHRVKLSPPPACLDLLISGDWSVVLGHRRRE